MVVQSICDGDKQTMSDVQETLDHRTVPPLSQPMSDMHKSWKQEETVTIQTP